MVLFANWKLEILLGGHLDLIEKGELSTLNKDITEICQLGPDLEIINYMVIMIK